MFCCGYIFLNHIKKIFFRLFSSTDNLNNYLQPVILNVGKGLVFSGFDAMIVASTDAALLFICTHQEPISVCELNLGFANRLGSRHHSVQQAEGLKFNLNLLITLVFPRDTSRQFKRGLSCLNRIPTNTPRGFHVESTWCVCVESTSCV